MSDTFAISGLVRKHAELAGEMEAARARLDGMTADLASVDRVLRLLDPGIRLDAIRPKAPRPAGGPGRPEITTRMILGVLREAGEPLGNAGIAGRLELGGGDPKVLRDAAERVGDALRRQRARGVVGCREGPGGRLLWELAGSS